MILKICSLAIAAGWLAIATTAHGRLFDRGNGLIYDDVLGVTWLQNANYCATNPSDPACELGGAASDGTMTWEGALAWADGLVYQGLDDWRLPTLSPINGASFQTGAGQFTNNATSDEGFAKTTTDGTDGGWRDEVGIPVSEMGHMYYVNLRNLGSCTPDDANPSSCVPQSGGGLTSTSFVDAATGETAPILNLQPASYWTGLPYVDNLESAWVLNFNSGYSAFAGDRRPSFFAWAVRSGDVPPPTPGLEPTGIDSFGGSSILSDNEEVCILPDTLDPAPQPELNKHLPWGAAGHYTWTTILRRKPRGNINVRLQCGVLKPNAYAVLGMPDAIETCAGETGEETFGLCARAFSEPNTSHIKQNYLPTVTAVAFPLQDAPFNLTAYRAPSAFSNIYKADMTALRDDSKNLEVLDGDKSSRVVLTSCVPLTIFVKMPITGQINGLGQVETDLDAGDEIAVKLDFPRGHTMDVYCDQHSVEVLGFD